MTKIDPRPVQCWGGPVVLRGWSRIRTLEGVRRRIYSPLHRSRGVPDHYLFTANTAGRGL